MNKALVIVVIIVVVAGVILALGRRGSYAPTTTRTTPTKQQPNTISSPQTETDVQEKTVTVTSLGFEPKIVTVKAGTKVVWINNSAATANVSSAVHPTHLVYPPLNLGSFENGKTVSLIFDKPGTYKYHNHLNPSQTGQVVIE